MKSFKFPCSVFIADDDAEDRDLIKEAFEANNYNGSLLFASNGAELLSKMETSTPSMILLDLNMPKKDGRETLRELKSSEKFKLIPVVILSTSSNDEDINLSYNLGCNCYITKPGNFRELSNAIKSITQYWLKVYQLPNLN